MSENKRRSLGIDFFPQKHNSLISYGYLITIPEMTIYFSGDTEEIPNEVLHKFLSGNIDKLFLDTSFIENNNYHLTISNITILIPENLRNKIYCMHLADDCNITLLKEFNIIKVKEK